MKYILTTVTLLISTTILLGQSIGINTATPLNDIHVNGSIQLTNELNVGGTDLAKGESGNDGQILISKGEKSAPKWVTVNIPKVPKGSFSLTNTLIMRDTLGVNVATTSTRTSYKEGEVLKLTGTDRWYLLEQLTSKIKTVDVSNKVNIVLQTLAHLDQTAIEESVYNFAIGVFIDQKLKAVKTYNVSDGGSPFSIVTLMATIENIPPGEYDLHIAIIPRSKVNYNNILTVGKPNNNTTNISPFMATSSLKIDIFEQLNK